MPDGVFASEPNSSPAHRSDQPDRSRLATLGVSDFEPIATETDVSSGRIADSSASRYLQTRMPGQALALGWSWCLRRSLS